MSDHGKIWIFIFLSFTFTMQNREIEMLYSILRLLKSFLMEVKDLFILYNQYHGCWWPSDTRSQHINKCGLFSHNIPVYRVDSRLVPSQWETPLQSNTVSHWLGTNLESALVHISVKKNWADAEGGGGKIGFNTNHYMCSHLRRHGTGAKSARQEMGSTPNFPHPLQNRVP